MKRNGRKLALNRDTVRNLAAPELGAAAAAGTGTWNCTNYVSCHYTACNNCTVSCATCFSCLTCAGC